MHTPRPSMTDEILRRARGLGSAAVGIAPAAPLQRGETALAAWLAEGHHGEMAYMAAPPARSDARALLSSARSVIVIALPYSAEATPDSVARFARGADYHHVLKQKLQQLADACSEIAGRAVESRACVDSAPLLEREMAERAGLAFVGKSTMSIIPGVGTYFVLGELLVDLDLTPSQRASARCGDCSACLDRCPTGAFVRPGVLDARKCISYLTIELRLPIPRELRPLMGEHVFGCDICQEVCPFNTKASSGAVELEPQPALRRLPREELLSMGSSVYRRLVEGTALRRVSRNRMARNAAIALGNSGRPQAADALLRALREHRSGLVRGHAAWALGRLGSTGALGPLRAALADADGFVAEEAACALRELG